MIRYISTRGTMEPQSFFEVLLSGMAPDGGLYIPESWPELDIGQLRGMDYAEVAMEIIRPFIGNDLAPDVLQKMLEDTYEGGAFDHEDVAPLVQMDENLWIMELFHGPTLSFKDYALQFVGRLFAHVLAQQDKQITIVGATSGDTGSAAIEACKACKNIDIFILHPEGRTSDIQRRQMTSIDAPNVYNIALQGNFDDCQAVVKAIFADESMRTAYNISAVNSINWARIMAQIVYYFTAALSLGAAEKSVSFTVPTGNFGNIYAAYCARRMGLPVHKLVMASNRNDILTRFFESGVMKKELVTPSLSPSMDIQVSSNFERYLFDLCERDHQTLTGWMDAFESDGLFSIQPERMEKVRSEFQAYRGSDTDTITTIRDCYKKTGLFIDPHTAVGFYAAQQAREKDRSVPMVSLACAHPAKFPDAVKEATKNLPVVPGRLNDVLHKEEHYTILPHDLEQVKDFIRRNASC